MHFYTLRLRIAEALGWAQGDKDFQSMSLYFLRDILHQNGHHNLAEEITQHLLKQRQFVDIEAQKPIPSRYGMTWLGLPPDEN